MAKYLDENGLIYVWSKLKSYFVKQEPGKGLSTHDLTDDLLQKIEDAGTSSFDGAYSSLTGKPSIGGQEIASGDQTAASLGLATPDDVSSAVAAEDSSIKEYIGQQGYQNASQVDSAIVAKGYQTADQVSQAVSTATADMATQTWVQGLGYQTSAQVEATVTGKGYQTSEQVQSAINSAVASVLTYKGTVADVASLPSTGQKVGDVWHVTADAGEYAWDGTEWQALGSSIDLSAYMLKTDVTAITNGDIDEIFA